MESTKKLPLENNQQYKHNFIRTFFRVNLPNIEEAYKKVNGSLDLDQEKWHRFVNSQELFDLIYQLISGISDFTVDIIAYSEPLEYLGDEMITNDFETYHAMPFIMHDKLQTPDEHLCTLQHATRCFITMINHMFFKHLYQRPFRILREIQDSVNTFVYLNDDLEYCLT